uniref:Uncharacterized protein n=1 Tax=Mycena chlorophos TaxID=658473 RepID=A0ABQ0M7D8_MYCCL|nr:predicted protein [Mycena chlorophos]
MLHHDDEKQTFRQPRSIRGDALRRVEPRVISALSYCITGKNQRAPTGLLDAPRGTEDLDARFYTHPDLRPFNARAAVGPAHNINVGLRTSLPKRLFYIKWRQRMRRDLRVSKARDDGPSADLPQAWVRLSGPTTPPQETIFDQEAPMEVDGEISQRATGGLLGGPSGSPRKQLCLLCLLLSLAVDRFTSSSSLATRHRHMDPETSSLHTKTSCASPPKCATAKSRR